ATLRRYAGERRSFEPVGTFDGARSIAVAGDWLYVAACKVVYVIDLKRLMVVERLTRDWEAVDVASRGLEVRILDRKHGLIYRHGPYRGLEQEPAREDRAGAWSRIAVDRDGGIYLLNGDVLERPDPNAPPIRDAGAIRDRFDPPPIRLDAAGRFCLPASLALACGRRLPDNAPQPEDPLALCRPAPPKALERTGDVAANGDFLLYVLRRRSKRLEAWTDDGRHLRHSWGACMDWQPVDVAACGSTAFALDEAHQAVFRHTAGREQLKELFRDETETHHWSRIACDGGMLLLHAPGAREVQVFDCSGRPRGERCWDGVKSLFDAERPELPVASEGIVFDRHGENVSVDFTDPSDTSIYAREGSWQSAPLDSLRYRCQWHRIELELSSFPPGSRLSVETCAHENEDDVHDPMKARFVPGQTIVAPLEGTRTSFDLLVQSGLGRYLTLKLRLGGDGFSTPAVSSAKIHYPRESYLEYLPATYSADDEARLFLERFLAIFQTEWDDLDFEIDHIERFFDPDAVPDGPAIDYLAAQWLALPLEGTWSDDQKRRLLSAVPKIYPRRGQASGLKDFLAVYLANLSGLETEEVEKLGFPFIVEGFRERQFFFGGSADASRLGAAGAPLWSPSVTRRIQLGVYSTEGEAELVSVGDPERDVFTEFAHKFRVYVPAGWVRSADDERMIR
ncbi:MAG: phage tail protein, partial [Thermoanaerobaculia bacterium]